MDPSTIAFIYIKYCQPIFCYGLETLFIGKTKLKEFKSRQSTVIKTMYIYQNIQDQKFWLQ